MVASVEVSEQAPAPPDHSLAALAHTLEHQTTLLVSTVHSEASVALEEQASFQEALAEALESPQLAYSAVCPAAQAASPEPEEAQDAQ